MKNPKFLTVRTRQEIRRIKTDDIIAIVGESYLASFIFKDSHEKFTCSKSLKELEGELPRNQYYRVSKSTLINLEEVVKVNTLKRIAVLADGSEHQVSFRRLKGLVDRINNSN